MANSQTCPQLYISSQKYVLFGRGTQRRIDSVMVMADSNTTAAIMNIGLDAGCLVISESVRLFNPRAAYYVVVVNFIAALKARDQFTVNSGIMGHRREA